MARTGSTTACHRAPGRTRTFVGIVVASVVVLGVLAGCTGDGDDGATPTTVALTTTTLPSRVDDGRLYLGVFLPRTGPGAVLGENMIVAINAAIAEINAAGGVLGQPVDARIVDENSGTLAELVADGVDAIVGPGSSLVALSQLDDAVGSPNGVVTCSPLATALALDDYPDNRLFYRTVPSDSLQMAAAATLAARTGVGTVAVGYLDDPFGRGLAEAFGREAAERSLTVGERRGFDPDEEDLAPIALELLQDDPAVVVVLGDADDGTRLLAAIDAATQGAEIPQIIVNDEIRNGRQTIQTLSDEFREQIIGVAPEARAAALGFPGLFTAHAVDCVNLIALATEQAASDNPRAIQAQMAAVSSEGFPCSTFSDCVGRLRDGLQIDYSGLSGPIELSSTTGDLTRAWFQVFRFDEEGVDVTVESGSPLNVS